MKEAADAQTFYPFISQCMMLNVTPRQQFLRWHILIKDKAYQPSPSVLILTLGQMYRKTVMLFQPSECSSILIKCDNFTTYKIHIQRLEGILFLTYRGPGAQYFSPISDLQALAKGVCTMLSTLIITIEIETLTNDSEAIDYFRYLCSPCVNIRFIRTQISMSSWSSAGRLIE